MSGTTLLLNDEPVWVAMPRGGSGTTFPIGVFTSKEECLAAQEGWYIKSALPMLLNVNHHEVGYMVRTSQ